MFAWLRRGLRNWLDVDSESWTIFRDVRRLERRADNYDMQLGIEKLPPTVGTPETGWWTGAKALTRLGDEISVLADRVEKNEANCREMHGKWVADHGTLASRVADAEKMQSANGIVITGHSGSIRKLEEKFDKEIAATVTAFRFHDAEIAKLKKQVATLQGQSAKKPAPKCPKKPCKRRGR